MRLGEVNARRYHACLLMGSLVCLALFNLCLLYTSAVNYLYEQGHKRIGCIAGPEEMPLCHYRLQGYVQALRRCGIMVEIGRAHV